MSSNYLKEFKLWSKENELTKDQKEYLTELITKAQKEIEALNKTKENLATLPEWLSRITEDSLSDKIKDTIYQLLNNRIKFLIGSEELITLEFQASKETLGFMHCALKEVQLLTESCRNKNIIIEKALKEVEKENSDKFVTLRKILKGKKG